MKKEISGLVDIHCVIHRKHFVARHLSAELHRSMQFFDEMRQQETHVSNDRLFPSLSCKDE